MIRVTLKKFLPFLPRSIKNIFIGDWNDAGLKKYFANTLWMFSGRFFLLATGFLVSALVARHLGPENYGLFNYVIGFGGLFALISGFGTNAILGRELLNNPERKALILGNAITLYAISSIVLIILINFVAYYSDPDIYTRQLIFVFSLTFVFQPVSVFDIYFQSEVKAKLITFVQFFVSLISIIFKLLGIFLGFYVGWFILVLLIEGLISVLLTTGLFLRSGIKPVFTPNPTLLRHLLIAAFPFMLSIVSTGVYMKIDQVMIKHMLNTTETGLYSVAVRLTEAWYFIPNLIAASLFPAIVNARRVSKEIYHNRISRLLLTMSILSLILILPLTLLARPLIILLFGEVYIDAYYPFIIYIWSSIFVFPMPVLHAYMAAEHKGYILLGSSIAGAVINIILNIILIPMMGIVGSAIATLIAYAVPVAVLFILFIRNQHTYGRHS